MNVDCISIADTIEVHFPESQRGLGIRLEASTIWIQELFSGELLHVEELGLNGVDKGAEIFTHVCLKTRGVRLMTPGGSGRSS